MCACECYYAHKFVWEYLCAFVVCQVLAYSLRHFFLHCVIMFSLSRWKNSHSFLYQLKRAFRVLPQQTTSILLLKPLFLTKNLYLNEMSALIGIVHPKMIWSSSCFSKTLTVFSQWSTKRGVVWRIMLLFSIMTVYSDATYKSDNKCHKKDNKVDLLTLFQVLSKNAIAWIDLNRPKN